jgi:CRP/FNR family transcriptional regulator
MPESRRPGSDIGPLRKPASARAAEAEDEFGALLRIGTRVAVRRGQTLFHQGDPARCLFRVVSGAIRSSRILSDGRRQIGDFFLSGDFFGFGATDVLSHSAEAIVDTAVSAYPHKALEGMLLQQPRLGRALLAVMSCRLADAQQRMVMLGCKTAEERVATFLIAMAERCGEGDVVHLPMTRADIADHLGLTAETVSRVLTKLRTDGLIAVHAAGEMHIIDREALKELAEGS